MSMAQISFTVWDFMFALMFSAYGILVGTFLSHYVGTNYKKFSQDLYAIFILYLFILIVLSIKLNNSLEAQRYITFIDALVLIVSTYIFYKINIIKLLKDKYGTSFDNKKSFLTVFTKKK